MEHGNCNMKILTIREAKANLEIYIAAAKRGEEIYIGAYGKPEVKLTPVKSHPRSKGIRSSNFKNGQSKP